MRRREALLAAALAAAAPRLARAQAGPPVIAFLSSYDPGEHSGAVASFRLGLSEAGLAEGRDFALEFRWAEGRFERLPALAAELAARKVAVIAAGGGNMPVEAASAATSSIPIVFVSGGDPVRSGLTASLGRPGGNVTGFILGTGDLTAKRLQLLKELTPGMRLVGMLSNPGNTNVRRQIEGAREAAGALGIELRVVEARMDGELETAFAALAASRVGAVLVSPDPMYSGRRRKLVALAASYRLPAIYSLREFVADGGLASYGPSLALGFRSAGSYVARILRGASPSDLPVTLPTTFELALNLKAAQALGIVIPDSIILQADEVIE